MRLILRPARKIAASASRIAPIPVWRAKPANFRVGGADSLFVDVRGSYGGSRSSGTDGALQVDTLYRIQNEGHACDDPNFKRTIVQPAATSRPGA
jgi:putative lipoprotein